MAWKAPRKPEEFTLFQQAGDFKRIHFTAQTRRNVSEEKYHTRVAAAFESVDNDLIFLKTDFEYVAIFLIIQILSECVSDFQAVLVYTFTLKEL